MTFPFVIGVSDGAPLLSSGGFPVLDERQRPSVAAEGRIGHRHVQRADGPRGPRARETLPHRLRGCSGSPHPADRPGTPVEASLDRSASSSRPPRTRPVTRARTAEAPSWPSWALLAPVRDVARCRWPASAADRDDSVRTTSGRTYAPTWAIPVSSDSPDVADFMVRRCRESVAMRAPRRPRGG